MPRGWLTPDTLPSTATRRALLIPDSPIWEAIVTGAILELTYNFNWEQFGELTVEECTARMLTMLNQFLDGVGMKEIGELIPWCGDYSPKPSVWLPCNGQGLLRTEYPELFAVIGTAFGAGDITHFNIPDLRGQTLIHQGSGYTFASAVGEAEHVLTIDELAQHSHYDNGHNHGVWSALPGLALAPGEEPVLVPSLIGTTTDTGYADIATAGLDAAHNNMQPSMPITYLIVAKEG